MVPFVFMSVATRVVGASARPLCAGVVLAISLMCAVLGVAASTTPMPGMSGMVNASGVSFLNDMGEATVAPVAAAFLALFLASRRDTFLGLLARIGALFFVRRRRRPLTPWTVLSLSSLCVLRV